MMLNYIWDFLFYITPVKADEIPAYTEMIVLLV